MNGRNRIIVLASLVVALAIAISTGGIGQASAPRASTYTAQEQAGLASGQPRAMTLIEAWDLADKYAQKWQPGAFAALVQSVDSAGEKASSGQDGRRRAWQAILAGTGLTRELWVRFVDGVVVEKVEQPSTGRVAGVTRPALDSSRALALAQAAKPGFEPTDQKGTGYHFALERRNGESLVVVVRGTHRGKPAMVDLDANTGAILAARFLTFADSGGILYSADAGETWSASSLAGKMIPALQADPLTADQAYAAATENGQISTYQTRDGGRTWALMSELPAAAGEWPFALNAVAGPSGAVSLLVGTHSGLWISTDRKTWDQAAGLPQGPKQWLGAVQSNAGYRVFASITAGQEQGLYASTDLAHWTRVASGNYRLSESFDRQTVLATDEGQSGQALVLSASGQARLQVPGSVLHAAGAFDGSAPMIVHVSSGVSQFSGPTERRSLTVPVASLAVARSYASNPIALAGGFRTGLYRTTDGGGSWRQVLADPSQLVPGSGEIVGVKFLSQTFAIAINGGKLTWKDF